MEAPLYQSTQINSIITFLFFFIFVLIPTSYSLQDEGYTDCYNPFDCGNLKGISYPFWSSNSNRSQRCGESGFELKCQQNQNPVITIGSSDFFVLDVTESRNLITIARVDFWNNTCPENFVNSTFDNSLFTQTGFENISFFYNCNISKTFSPTNFSCPGYNKQAVAFYATDKFLRDRNLDVSHCQVSIQVPVSSVVLQESEVMSGTAELERVLRDGFNVSYSNKNEKSCQQCVSSGGVCGTNTTSSSFACHCSGEHTSPYVCLQQSKVPSFAAKIGEMYCKMNQENVKWKVIIGVASGGLAMLVTCTIIRNWRRIREWGEDDSLRGPIGFCSGKRKGNQVLEAFVKNYGPLSPTRFSFSEIKKMTSSFKVKLGQGGYGDVYKGNLLDGRLVAVKVLNASKGTGEEFINEVASISRTSHVNIVALLGFCLEGEKRALIYEFMPNGSLEKFIFKRSKSKNEQKLGWKKLYEIAVGVAKGLEYLHCGCNTRIVHFDIKPTNVLLDEDFCPKISDFGLAKLCARKESVVSMLHARGTIGYIAPEVFSRTFGGVSHKSDVYSYGMMVLEMAGGREDFDGDDETTEAYFPQWVHKHLELEKEFEWPGVEETEEVEIVKKMTLVGLWCIQTKPSERPSMSKVIEMMEGKIEALKVPPKPFLFSPEQSPPSYSSSTSDHMVFGC